MSAALRNSPYAIVGCSRTPLPLPSPVLSTNSYVSQMIKKKTRLWGYNACTLKQEAAHQATRRHVRLHTQSPCLTEELTWSWLHVFDDVFV